MDSNWPSEVFEWEKLKDKLAVLDGTLVLREDDGPKIVVPTKLV
jgi:hypothetical protein